MNMFAGCRRRLPGVCFQTDRDTTTLWRYTPYNEHDGHTHICGGTFFCSGTGDQWGSCAQGVSGKIVVPPVLLSLFILMFYTISEITVMVSYCFLNSL